MSAEDHRQIMGHILVLLEKVLKIVMCVFSTEIYSTEVKALAVWVVEKLLL